MRILACTLISMLVVAILLWCGYQEARDFVRKALTVAPGTKAGPVIRATQAERAHFAAWLHEGDRMPRRLRGPHVLRFP